MALRTRWRTLSFGLAAVFVHSLAWSDPILSNVQVGQQDWIGPNGSLVAEDSLWGYFSFDYTSDPNETFFINVSASLGGGPAQWIIQNIPLFASSGPSSLGLDFDFSDFGITAGTDVASLDVDFSLSDVFQFAPPAGGASTMAVAELTHFAWNDIGAPGGTVPFDDPGAPKGSKNTAEPEAAPKERDIRPLQEDDNQCFPGSMARSLDWLNREKSLGVDKPLGDIYKELRDKVKNPEGDDSVAKATTQLRLKSEYAKDTFKKIRTKIYDASGFVNPIPGVKERTPKDQAPLDWLTGEIKTEDIELAYYWIKGDEGSTTDGAHIVTLVSIYKTKDGKTKVRYRDDEVQSDDTKGDAQIKEAELYEKNGQLRFGADGNRVWYLASESVPEPTTVQLLMLGLGLVGYRRVMRPARPRAREGSPAAAFHRQPPGD